MARTQNTCRVRWVRHRAAPVQASTRTQAGAAGSGPHSPHYCAPRPPPAQVVDDRQALAFFLPGVVSSLAKQIYAATGAGVGVACARVCMAGAPRHTMQHRLMQHRAPPRFGPRPVHAGNVPAVRAATGSGSGSKATAAAVDCLARIIAITLADAHGPAARASGPGSEGAGVQGVLAALGGAPGRNGLQGAGAWGEAAAGGAEQEEEEQEGEGAGPSSAAQAALAALQGMARPAAAAAAPAAPAAPPRSSPAAAPQGTSGSSGGGPDRSLRVQCDAEWARASAERVAGLLGRALPPLCSHPRPSVREALAVGEWVWRHRGSGAPAGTAL